MIFLLAPLREGRPMQSCGTSASTRNFYSRPYARGNLRLPAAGSAVRCNFYSRPYARGDTTLTDFIRNTPLFLLAPLREGRLQLGVEVILHDAISTPAPTRGATRTFAVGLGSSGLNFYSRPYERGDVSERPQQQRHHAISTRAPTRGATRAVRLRASISAQFLLAPLREGRQQFFTKP